MKVFFLFVLLAIMAPPVAFAATHSGGTTGGTTITLDNPIACTDLECVVLAIVRALNILAIPLVTLMALIGGFQFMTAGGDPKKVENGKKTLWYAVLGYAIIFLANGIVFIIRDILN